MMNRPITIHQVTPVSAQSWPDLEDLFGENGACAGCWCMWWRTPRANYRAGSGNRVALRNAVATGESVGMLAYATDPDSGHQRAVGWCAVAPRTAYPRLSNSAVGRVNPDPAGRWAVPCFFVRRGYRRQGVTDALLGAACEHARAHGAQMLEGYPLTVKASASDLFVGTHNLFARHGFVVVARPSVRRAVMQRPA